MGGLRPTAAAVSPPTSICSRYDIVYRFLLRMSSNLAAVNKKRVEGWEIGWNFFENANFLNLHFPVFYDIIKKILRT